MTLAARREAVTACRFDRCGGLAGGHVMQNDDKLAGNHGAGFGRGTAGERRQVQQVRRRIRRLGIILGLQGGACPEQSGGDEECDEGKANPGAVTANCSNEPPAGKNGGQTTHAVLLYKQNDL